MSFSNYQENKILNAVYNGAALSNPATVYTSLHTADPGETGATAEATYTGYARKGATANTTNFPTTSSGVIANGIAITFDPCTGGSNAITHFAHWDAVSGGNCIGSGALTSTLNVSNGVTPSFAIGAMTVTLD